MFAIPKVQPREIVLSAVGLISPSLPDVHSSHTLVSGQAESSRLKRTKVSWLPQPANTSATRKTRKANSPGDECRFAPTLLFPLNSTDRTLHFTVLIGIKPRLSHPLDLLTHFPWKHSKHHEEALSTETWGPTSRRASQNPVSRSKSPCGSPGSN